MDTKEQVLSFLEKCEDLKKCKFIMATTKIKDLLKCIVNCSELYRLFEAVTKNFNYPEAKSKYLVTVNDGIFEKSYVALPNTVGERLAFVFCLFVEFDRDTLNFNDFLRRFYPEDGSYFASYQSFCNTIVNGLEDAIGQVFVEELAEEQQEDIQVGGTEKANSLKAELLSALNLAISEEMQFVANSNIPEEDKQGGQKILAQLFAAIRTENENLIDALICGYNYFVLYHRCVSGGVPSLVQTIAAYEKTL